jgi:Planctomycete cytochrome C
MHQWIMVAGLLTLILITSCKHEPLIGPVGEDNTTQGSGNNGNNNNGIPCDSNTVYFSTQILPILVSNCAKSGCHDALSHEDGVILDSYANVMATANVQPFDPSHGKLLESITETDPDDVMPPLPNSPLTAQQINLIQTWIQQGAQNLFCTNSSCDSTSVSYLTNVEPIINNSCKGCHSGSNPGGGITLNSYATVAAQANNGKLLGSIIHAAGYAPMPKNSASLSTCEIGIIRNWILEGTLNN